MTLFWKSRGMDLSPPWKCHSCSFTIPGVAVWYPLPSLVSPTCSWMVRTRPQPPTPLASVSFLLLFDFSTAGCVSWIPTSLSVLLHSQKSCWLEFCLLQLVNIPDSEVSQLQMFWPDQRKKKNNKTPPPEKNPPKKASALIKTF